MPNVGNLDLTRQLQRFLDARGSLQLALDETLLPVVNAFNLDDPPFHSKRGAFFSRTYTPPAGEYARFRLRNASADPQSRIVVRYFSFWRYGGEAVASFSFLDAAAPLANLTAGLPSWDNGRFDATIELSWQNSAVPDPGPFFLHYYGAGSAPSIVPGPFVISPGRCMEIYGGVAAGEMRLGLYADLYENA